MGATVVLVGLGHLGGPLLDQLAGSALVGRVVALSRSSDQGEARCNLSRLSAIARGSVPNIEHRTIDVADPGQLAAVIEEVSPDLVINAASMQTWWLLDLFPPAANVLKAAGFGVWLPFHLRLAVRVMEGVVASSYKGPVVNAAYPDVVNAVLAKMGMAPTVGIGNVDELVAKVRMLVAHDLSIRPHELKVVLVAHHALQRVAFHSCEDRSHTRSVKIDEKLEHEAPPYHLRVLHKGRDLTEQADAHGALLKPCPLPNGPGWGAFTAASAIGLVNALLSENTWEMHAPGPLGLPGGYPVSIGDGKIAVPSIRDLSLDEAISINEKSHQFDGIARIEENGAVVLTEAAIGVMRDSLGYDNGTVQPAEVDDHANELARCFNEYARRHDVDVEVKSGMTCGG